MKKNFMVPFVPKRQMVAPVPPRLNLPRLPSWSEPVYRIRTFPPVRSKKARKRQAASEMKRYRAFLANRDRQRTLFDLRYERAVAARKAAIALYNARLAKYELLLKAFTEYSRKRLHGIVKWKRVRTRERPNNPYSRVRTFDLGFTGRLQQTVRYGTSSGLWGCYSVFPDGAGRIGYWDVQSGYFGNRFRSHGTPPSGLAARVESKANSALYQRMNELNLHIGNLIAERAQTIDMFANFAKTLAKLVKSKRAFVRGMRRIVALSDPKHSKDVADATLAIQFGVRPLVADVFSAAEAAAKLVYNPRSKVRLRSKASLSDSTTKVTVGGNNSDERLTQVVKQTVTVRYVLDYEISNSPLHTLQSFGLVNPAEIAWELMPWSFVVDWFLPVGNYIQNLSADAGLTYVGGVKTVVTTTEYFTTLEWLDIPYNTKGSYRRVGCVNGYKKVESKVRTVLTTPPSVRLPSFKNPFSFDHLVDAIALIRQRVHPK